MQKATVKRLIAFHPAFPACMSLMFLVHAIGFAFLFASLEAMFLSESIEFSKHVGADSSDWLFVVFMGRPWLGLGAGLAVGCVAYGFEKARWNKLLRDSENIRRQSEVLHMNLLLQLWLALRGRVPFGFSWPVVLGILAVVSVAFIMRFSLATSVAAFGAAWCFVCPEYRRLFKALWAHLEQEADTEEEVLQLARTKRNLRFIVPALLTIVLVFGFMLVRTCASFSDIFDDAELAELGRDSLISTGEELTPEEVSEVQHRFERNSENPNLRLLLLGYYGKHREESEYARKEHACHALWCIQVFPRDFFLGESGVATLTPERDGEAYERAAAIWREHVERWPEDHQILANAAMFFFGSDKDYGVELLERGEALQPEQSWWPESLGRLHAHGLLTLPDAERAEAAKQSLAAYERAVKLTKMDTEKLRVLVSLAPIAYEAGEYARARAAGEEILAGAVGSGLPHPGWAVHLAHTVLGRVALQEGDVTGAEEQLKQSLAALDTYDRNTFKPRFTLAWDLLARGRTEAVLEYLAECAKDRGPAPYEDWAAAIRAGRTPDWGDALSGGPE